MVNQVYVSAEFLISIVLFFKKDRRRFPFVIESTLAWLAAFILAFYLGICYFASIGKLQLESFLNLTLRRKDREPTFKKWNVPLTTTTRGREVTLADALQQLEALLKKISLKKDSDASSTNSPNINSQRSKNDEFMNIMRSSVEARRLASIVMKHKIQQKYTVDMTHQNNKLCQQLEQTWSELIKFPPIDQHEYAFQITLVVPAYNENGGQIQCNLQRALLSCQCPKQVQLVLVDAGRNIDIEKATVFDNKDKQWGDIKRVLYSDGGGRGPALNFGAMHADGRIITFLHSDNILPDRWDHEIISIFAKQQEGAQQEPKPIACAFSFKINTSKEAHNDGACPPGLAAAQWLGNLRTKQFHVLYGDSVLSLPAPYLRYIGGYPDQALMEDYELMDLLRKRVSFLSSEEKLCIIPSETLVSPRRWQTNGVTYVILFNCLCVFLYENMSWTPEALYKFYYQRPSSP